MCNVKFDYLGNPVISIEAEYGLDRCAQQGHVWVDRIIPTAEFTALQRRLCIRCGYQDETERAYFDVRVEQHFSDAHLALRKAKQRG